MTFNSEFLPAPLGPIKEQISAERTANVMFDGGDVVERKPNVVNRKMASDNGAPSDE